MHASHAKACIAAQRRVLQAEAAWRCHLRQLQCTRLTAANAACADAESKRLVGVQIPEGAVDEVLQRLAGRDGNAISLSDSEDDTQQHQPQPLPQQLYQQPYVQPWQHQHQPQQLPPAGAAGGHAWQQPQPYNSIDLT